jgi:O-antigen ligase
MDWRGARIYGNLFWPNSYTVYLLPAIMILYARLRKRLTRGNLLVIALLLIMDFLTFSRSGLLCLAVSIVVFEIAGKGLSKISAKKFLMLFLLIAGIFVYSNAINYLNPRYTPSTISERTGIWDTILPFLQGKLIFGNGLGSYELYRSQVLHSLSPHNSYLMVLFELGIVGLAVMLLFVFTMFRDLYILARDETGFPFGRLGLSIFSGIVVISLVGGAGFAQVVSLDSWVVIGCCLIPAAAAVGENLHHPAGAGKRPDEGETG